MEVRNFFTGSFVQHTSLQHILEYTSEPKPSHLMYNENDFSAVPEERGLRQRTADDGFGPVGVSILILEEA
jgi:hypothetical protein